MKRFNLRRLLFIAFATVLLCVGAFWVTWTVRVEHELHHPAPEATAAEAIHVMSGFKVELIHSATTNEDSWITMAIDPKGRFIISPHLGPLLRMTLENGKFKKTERLDLPCGDAMGLLYASNYLYLDCKGPAGLGLYRARDLGDRFGAPELLRHVNFWMYDHGAHGFAVGPDRKLYVVCGNATELPKDISTNSPMRNFATDSLLPADPDPTGAEIGHKAVSGFVLRMDLDGKNCELFAGGSRNDYAIAFNADGELFGTDNDMNWEWGVDWYRLCRLHHWVSGGDLGYREGTSKVPTWDEDILPGTRDIGLGAPTGVKFPPATFAFPDAYRDACFAQDWAYGRLLAVHLIPHGASYVATAETILRGTPLNMSAMEFGPEGNLYFITGGHETDSGLYRVSYVGEQKPAPLKVDDKDRLSASAARTFRRSLEKLQGHRDPQAVDFIWRSGALGSDDRWIRYAARTALEAQDLAAWKDRALGETNVMGGLTALLALARCGGPETQEALLKALEKFPISSLTHEQELLELRVMEISFTRQGGPPQPVIRHLAEMLDSLYPAATDDLNHELCQLLLYLNAPGAVSKTMALLEKAPDQETQTYYVMRLRTITNGWMPDLRKQYLTWFLNKRDPLAHRADVLAAFREVDLDYSDGPGFAPFLENFRDEFVANLGASERKALANYIPPKTNVFRPLITPVIPGGETKNMKHWRLSDLEPDLPMVKWHRSIARGRQIYSKVGCILCHRFASHGGAVGPDLTAVASRMTARGILESIIEPSKVLLEEYQNMYLTMDDGDVLTGHIIDENQTRVVLMTDLISRTTVDVPVKSIVSRRPSKISPMPEGLLDALSEDEIWDLIAFLQRGGKTSAPAR